MSTAKATFVMFVVASAASLVRAFLWEFVRELAAALAAKATHIKEKVKRRRAK